MKLTAHPLAEPLSAEAGAAVPAAAPPTDRQLMLRLRVSLALLLAKGDELSVTFYAILFARCPALRPLFPADMARQHSKLTGMLAWIVTHLDQRDALLPAVRELGARHADYGAAAAHYPLVRDALIEAMARTAGANWDDELAADWRLSIDLIARHMLTATSSARR